MSLPNLIRRRVHSVTVLRRHGSSTATNDRPHRMLPDEKLRALISLYHQADHFITLENLSQRIDEAFTKDPTMHLGYANSVKILKETLDEHRKQARVTEWDKQTANNYTDVEKSNDRWSGIKMGRELKVKQALYGLSDEGNLPGLEILKDVIANGGKPLERLENDVRDLLEDTES